MEKVNTPQNNSGITMSNGQVPHLNLNEQNFASQNETSCFMNNPVDDDRKPVLQADTNQLDDMPNQSAQRGNQYQKRVYVKASNEQRENIIKLVIHHKYKIADAAEHVGIGYENAKQILKVYHRQGRKHSLLSRPIRNSKEGEEKPSVHAETKFLEKRKKYPKPV